GIDLLGIEARVPFRERCDARGALAARRAGARSALHEKRVAVLHVGLRDFLPRRDDFRVPADQHETRRALHRRDAAARRVLHPFKEALRAGFHDARRDRNGFDRWAARLNPPRVLDGLSPTDTDGTAIDAARRSADQAIPA